MIFLKLSLTALINSYRNYYCREEVLKEVTASHREKRDLVMLRNEFAYYMKQKANLPLEGTKNEETTSLNSNKNLCNDANRFITPPELPEPINHPKACQMCPYSIICTTYLRYGYFLCP